MPQPAEPSQLEGAGFAFRGLARSPLFTSVALLSEGGFFTSSLPKTEFMHGPEPAMRLSRLFNHQRPAVLADRLDAQLARIVAEAA